jgi:hypothetical protein
MPCAYAGDLSISERAPPLLSITVDCPASRRRPVAICSRSPPVTCLHRLHNRQSRGREVGPTSTESRAQGLEGERRSWRRSRRALVPDCQSVRIVNTSELLDPSLRTEVMGIRCGLGRGMRSRRSHRQLQSRAGGSHGATGPVVAARLQFRDELRGSYRRIQRFTRHACPPLSSPLAVGGQPHGRSQREDLE